MRDVAQPRGDRGAAGDRLLPPENELQSKGPVAVRSWGVLVTILVVLLGYGWHWLNIGWIPNDEGTLAQSALRVLNGQLPHRDFVEIYTGGMSYYHAAAFWALGRELVPLRIAIFVLFALSVPAVFYLASRFVRPLAAAGVTLLAEVWGFPNYPAAMPSWYNLFFAIFGMATIFRYLESEKRRWLFLGGLAGGVSCLVKVTGLYYVAAVLLFFVFREQEVLSQEGHSVFYRIVALACLLLFLVAWCVTVGTTLGAAGFIHFILPVMSLVLFLVWREFHLNPRRDSQRFTAMMRMLAPFLGGLLFPVMVFLIPYVRTSSLGALVRGVFHRGAAATRTMAVMEPPALPLMIFAIALLFAIAMTSGVSLSRNHKWLLGLVAVLVLLVGRAYTPIARIVWYSAATLTPLMVIFGLASLGKANSVAIDCTSVKRERVMLLVSGAGMCSLIQFPFPAPIYFCYFAPLLVLAFCAALSSYKLPNLYVCGVTIAFYFGFAVLVVAPSAIYATLDVALAPKPRTTSLPRTRGLRLDPARAQIYERMIPLIQEHAAGGGLIAAPECPELYFLTGLQNPTSNDGGAEPDQILQAISTAQVNVFVINERPFFRAAVFPPALRRAVEKRFPNSVSIASATWAKEFQIRWRVKSEPVDSLPARDGAAADRRPAWSFKSIATPRR